MFKFISKIDFMWDVFCEDYPFLAIPIIILTIFAISKIYVIANNKLGGAK